MDKSAFAGLVWSSTIWQGTYTQTFPSVRSVIGRQTSGWAKKPAEAENLSQPLSLQSGKNLGCADLCRYLRTRKTLKKSSLLERRFQHDAGAKQNKKGSGDGEMQFEIREDGEMVKSRKHCFPTIACYSFTQSLLCVSVTWNHQQ